MAEANFQRRPLVNLGCGTRFHPEWQNFDLTPTSPQVKAANFVEGIPLADSSVDCVYHSHVLEHLPKEVGRSFLAECRRVLVPGGVLRIVVPDLEQSARDYLAVLDARRRGESRGADHEWMLIELLDQLIRETPGGEFVRYLKDDHGNDRFLLPRLGGFGQELLTDVRAATPPTRSWKRRLFDRLTALLPWSIGSSLQVMRFRRAGEIHLWMYDEISLGDALRSVGFTDIRRETAEHSRIPDFCRYHLDTDKDGRPWKGVSLYVEAVRAT